MGSTQWTIRLAILVLFHGYPIFLSLSSIRLVVGRAAARDKLVRRPTRRGAMLALANKTPPDRKGSGVVQEKLIVTFFNIEI